MSAVEGLAEHVAGIDIDGPAADEEAAPEIEQPTEVEPAEAPAPEPEPEPDPEPALAPEPELEPEPVAPVEAATAEPVVAAGAELFDSGPYIEVPVVDGQTTDKLVIAFGGTIQYDAGDKEGQKLFEKLRLGKEIELRVAGTVVAKNGGYKINKTTEEETVTGKAGIKVDTVYLLTPEEL